MFYFRPQSYPIVLNNHHQIPDGKLINSRCLTNNTYQKDGAIKGDYNQWWSLKSYNPWTKPRLDSWKLLNIEILDEMYRWLKTMTNDICAKIKRWRALRKICQASNGQKMIEELRSVKRAKSRTAYDIARTGVCFRVCFGEGGWSTCEQLIDSSCLHASQRYWLQIRLPLEMCVEPAHITRYNAIYSSLQAIRVWSRINLLAYHIFSLTFLLSILYATTR